MGSSCCSHTTVVPMATSEPDNPHNPENPDFSELPELLWLKIFSLLNERDLLVLSVTCRKLYDVRMNSSALWYQASIRIGACNDSPNRLAVLNETERSVFRAHGHHLKKIQLHIDDISDLPIDNASYNLLLDAARSWQLKSLDIMFNKVTHTGPVMPTDVDHLLTTCLTSPCAQQLSKLYIWAPDWLHKEGKSGVVEVLKKAPFTSSLKRLILGEILPHHRPPAKLCKMIGSFQNLKKLVIPLSYVSDSLFNNLPKDVNDLNLLVNTLKESASGKVTNWSPVYASHPLLKVTATFTNLFNLHPTTSAIIPSVIPVTVIEIYQCHKGYNVEESFLKISALFSRKASVLICQYCDMGVTREQLLMDTVRLFPKLDTLLFNGSISRDTVVALAGMKKWISFQFNKKFIRFQDLRDRQERLKALCVEVSKILGYDWELCSEDFFVKCSHFSSSDPYTQPLSMKMSPSTITL